jgi:predicted peptidase
VVAAAVANLLQQLCQLPQVDRAAIYLAGWSMGGFGVCSVLARSDVPAAAVVVSGGCQEAGTIQRIARKPFWVAYGVNDSIVVPAHSRELIRGLVAAQCPVEIREFTDLNTGKPSAHVLACKNAFSDPALYEWLLRHRIAYAERETQN